MTTTTLATFQYDALGRRIAKSAAAGTTHYLYDGAQAIEEQSGGSTVTQYVYGLGTDGVLQLKRGGQTFYYYENSLGSIVRLADETGQVVEQYTYDAYGAPTITDGGGAPLETSAVGNPYLFTGRRLDSETGLYYYRARYYEPAMGRFLQRDPGQQGDSCPGA